MSALKNRFKKAGLAFGLTAALAASAVMPAAAAETTEMNATIQGGSLIVGIMTTQDLQGATSSNTIISSHLPQQMSGALQLSVDDNRGTGAGWSVTVQSTNFVWDGGDSTHDIPASQFSLTTAGDPTHGAGQAIDTTHGPLVPATISVGSLDSARTVLRADADYGIGIYGQELDVELTVPGDSRAGSYQATVTVTAAVAP